MRVTDHAREGSSLLVATTQGRLRLQPFAPNIVRVTFTREPHFSDRQSLMVSAQPASTPPDVREDEQALTLTTDELRLEIARDTAALTWRDAAGRLLTREPRRGGKILEETPVLRGVVDADARVQTRQSVDGERAVAEVRYVLDRQAWHTKLLFEFAEGEAIYGLGQHEEGGLNLRGQHQYLYQQNMKVAMPVLVSTRGWGLLLDAYSLMTFHDDGHGSYLWTDVAAELDYYFIHGPAFDRIIGGIRALTGKAAMLPRWAWGYVQSKERYQTQDELVDIAREYRRRRIPLDVIVQDWRTWPDGMWGEKFFDPTRFPDPRRLMDDLHGLNTRLLVSIWPNIRGGPNADEMRRHGFFLGNGSTYDAFNPRARELYWKQAHEGYFRFGIDGWWTDCTEPFEADWKGPVKPEPWQQMLINVSEFKKYLDPQFINAYALEHNRGLYEHQRQAAPDRRVVNLTRSAYVGQQRYGAITWSGDTAATWETLARQIPAGLSFCITGGPYWTFDIGAFFVRSQEQWFWRGDYDRGVDDLGYRELYTRWFQAGAFLPMFRSHGTDTPREVWRFGEKGDLFHDTLVRFIELRYRLMPYLYSLAGWVYHRDYTPMRALAFDFPHDAKVHDITDQFLLGPALMACPVLRPMLYGPNSAPLPPTPQTRRVYLPAGCDWVDFWTGQRHAGGQTIEAPAPLEIMPLYVRAGSILPLGPVVQHTAEQPDAPWELRLYPGADGGFDLYEDQGEGHGYEQGLCAWTPLQWSDRTGTLRLARRDGRFPGLVERRRLDLVRVAPGQGVGLPAATPHASLTYTGDPIEARL